MNYEEIEIRVRRIQDVAAQGDDEAAHSMEDDLHQGFIEYVASLPSPMSGVDAATLPARAKLIASTQDINFARWCA